MDKNYSKKFTLYDIFANKQLKDVLPTIKYSEKFVGDKFKQSAKLGNIYTRVFNTAKATAKVHFDPMESIQEGLRLTISGVGDLDACHNAVYHAISGEKQLYSLMANTMPMVIDALKLDQRSNAFVAGLTPRLYLRVSSIEQIKNMKQNQVYYLFKDIMNNLLYNDEYSGLRKKWGINDKDANWELDYGNWVDVRENRKPTNIIR